jgi:CyaY protein
VDLAGEILTLEFDDGTKYVANSHSAAQQIWLSANLAAWHFAWDGAQWKDTRTGKELFAELGRLVSEKLAQPLALRD